MKKFILVFVGLCLIPDSFSRDNYFRAKKHGYGILYGDDRSNVPMTRYYHKKGDIHDLWFDPKWEPLREVTFPKWEYEAPLFETASLDCQRVYKRKKSVHRNAPKIIHNQRKEPICGYKQAPESVYEYEEYTKPTRVRRKPLKKHFSRRNINRFTQYRNY
ncbi:MAG: hypothetical protein COB02_14060 [Candidatus Cloacimonadota bacterium]|nr:MAG: hypothetical protein COB02_14060 [Candidatus Cloacimonadota bacterium]